MGVRRKNKFFIVYIVFDKRAVKIISCIVEAISAMSTFRKSAAFCREPQKANRYDRFLRYVLKYKQFRHEVALCSARQNHAFCNKVGSLKTYAELSVTEYVGIFFNLLNGGCAHFCKDFYSRRIAYSVFAEE